MQTTAQRLSEPPAWLGTLFDRILCGVDGTESSRVAVEQAERLLTARRKLQLVSVVEELPAPWPHPATKAEFDRRCEEARAALRAGRALCPHARSLVAFGVPGPALRAALLEADATLAVAGAPQTGRLGGVVLGSVGTYLLHSAPCSVLIARATSDSAAFPRSIVAGHDGSAAAAAAVTVARELAQRFDASLRIVAATGGAPVDVARLEREEGLEWSPLRPTEALVAASEDADLLVVASRGRRGLRSLGSVSERVGHLARCSVLVLREPLHPQVDSAPDDAVPDSEC